MGGELHGPSIKEVFEEVGDRPVLIVAWVTGGIALCLTLLIYLGTLFNHLYKIRNNRIRNLEVGIIHLPLVFATTAYICLFFFRAAVLAEFVRSCFEAVVLYWFLSLLVRLGQGYKATLVYLREEGKKRYLAVPPFCCLCYCCCPPFYYNAHVLRFNRYGILQLVIMLPILALISLFLALTGNYEEGNIDFSEGFIYINIIHTASLMIALWSLFILLKASSPYLKRFNPTFKFLSIKLLLLLVIVQGIFFSILKRAGAFDDDDDDSFDEDVKAEAWQNWLVLLEMPFVAILLFFAFPRKDSLFGVELVELMRERRQQQTKDEGKEILTQTQKNDVEEEEEENASESEEDEEVK